MSKVKEIREKPSKIKNVKEKEIDESPLEEEVEQTSNQQFTEFISTGRTNVPVLESGQEVPQDAPTTEPIVREITPRQPDLPEGPEYQPVVLSKLASGSYDTSPRGVPNAPVLQQSRTLIEPSDRLGLGERSSSIHAEEEKYSEKAIESEDMKPERKMPWEQ